MKKEFFSILASALLFSSCYNYDGPTRPPVSLGRVAPTKSQLYLNSMADAVKSILPSAHVEILQDSIKILFPDNIQYKSSSTIPIKDVNYELGKLAGLINLFDKTNVLITGHTDNSGDEVSNKKISELRAKHVLDILIKHNAPEERINAWGLGSISPISSERTKEGKRNNRRVEFIILASMGDEEDDL